MPIGSILLVSALSFIVLLYLFSPFISGEGLGRQESSQSSSLLAERERVLTAVLELENDHEMGKVPEEVYATQRENLMKKGAAVLKKLEKMDDEKDGEVDIEKMIAKHKKKKSK